MAEIINGMSEEDQALYYEDFTEEDWAALEYDADFWLRPNQKIDTTGGWYITALVAGRGYGKAIHVTTPVPTPSGWVQMGDIKDGDTVFDENGKITKVIKAHNPFVSKKSYKLTFSDGEEIVADSEHYWTTWTHSDRKSYNRRDEYIESNDALGLPEDWPTWSKNTRWGHPTGAGPKTRTTQEIVDTFRYGKRGDLNHSIPVTKPLEYPKQDLLIDPYLFGLWIGDGLKNVGEVCGNIADHEYLVGEMHRRGYETLKVRPVGGVSQDCVTVTFKGLRTALGKQGSLGSKSIPEGYLMGSIDQRRDFLAGLLDSDGHISPISGVIEFCSKREDHAEAVMELARSLGQKPKMYLGRATLNGVDHGTKYRVSWRPTENFFKLPRKVSTLQPLGAQASRTMHRMITGYEEITDQAVRCLTVDSPNRLFLVGKGMIPTHNTRTMSEWCRKFVAENPGCRIAIGGRTSADIRNTMITGDSGLLAVTPPDERPVYKMHTSTLEWPNGSTALLLSSESPDQARGPQFHAAILDEFAAWKTTPDASGATLYDNILLATRLGDKPKILMATTPKKTKVMRNLMEQAEDPARNTRIIRGSTLENSSLSASYIENLLLKYGDSDLAKQEIGGLMLDDSEGAVFTQQMIDKAEDCGRIPSGLMKIIAVDPSVAADPKNRDDCGIMVIGCTREADPRRRTAYVLEDSTINASPDVWSKEVADVAKRWGIKDVVAESNQGGALITSAIIAENNALKVHLVHATKGKVKRVEPIVIAMQQGRVKLAEDFLELKDQLIYYDPEISDYSPDRMDAFAWGCTALLIEQPKGLVFGTLRSDKQLNTTLPTRRMTDVTRTRSTRRPRR